MQLSKLNRKGFTLAEMLIVMAVAVVLAAATIPGITGQIEKAKEANDITVIADAYADAYTQAAIAASNATEADSTGKEYEITGLKFQQATSGWVIYGSTNAPTVGGQSVSVTKDTTKLKFKFSNTADGSISLMSITDSTGGT